MYMKRGDCILTYVFTVVAKAIQRGSLAASAVCTVSLSASLLQANLVAGLIIQLPLLMLPS